MMKRPLWLDEPALRTLFDMTDTLGGEARVVGGAVRDALLELPAGDVDIASTLLPEQTVGLAEKQGWKAIPTGIAHGTVTLVLPNRTVEVTTLRKDVETDGRHAVVAFTDSFEEDASRRDFTINALYMDAYGNVHDYFNGVQHLAQQKIVFIGDAEQRIREDGLRMLRFFRFLATHGKAPADAHAIQAITLLREQVDALSGERIAVEMRKLLQAKDPIYALEQMDMCGFAPHISLGSWQVDSLAAMLQLEAQQMVRASAWARQMVLLDRKERSQAAHWIADRWKVSRQARLALMTLSAPLAHVSSAQVKEWMRMKPVSMVQDLLLLAAVDEALAEPVSTLMKLTKEWQVPVFPVAASDLLQHGYEPGVKLGMTLRVLEAAWAASDYRLGKEALLDTLITQD